MNWKSTLDHDFSTELLQQLEIGIVNHQIKTIWFAPIWPSTVLRGLWLYVQDKNQVNTLFISTYNQSLLNTTPFFIVMLDEKDLGYHATIGNTIFKTNLTAANLIYQATPTTLPQVLYKSLGSFIALYQDKHALLSSYCHDLMTAQYQGSSHAFLKALTYDLDVLETVLLGTKNSSMTLTHRLLLLEQIIPQIKTLFVKRETDVYYILDDLAQDIEDVQYNIWNSSLQKIQKKLKLIVLKVLDQIDGQTSLILPKRTLKKKKKKNKPFKYKEKLLPLLMTNQIEEIYQFHETLYLQQENQQKHIYLLILTKETPSKELNKIINKIECQEQSERFTILVHTRLYIQEYVYEFAEFFKNIVQPKNRIYASDYYPQIHWYKSNMIDYSDFMHCYKEHLKQANQTIQQHLQNPKNKTFVTTYHLHICLTVKLQVYILHHLHYQPQTKSINTLLCLALYAKNTEAPLLKALYDLLFPLVLDYTIQNKQEKKYNLVLDEYVTKHLQQFFSTLEV